MNDVLADFLEGFARVAATIARQVGVSENGGVRGGWGAGG